MATARTSSGTAAGAQAPAPEPERDYRNPGIFVVPWQPLFIVDDVSLGSLLAAMPSVRVPWSSLAIIKQYAPEQSRELVICGWDGVAQVLKRVEEAIIRQARETRR